LQVYRDIETRVTGHSRSSKILPFDPASMTSYQRFIVTIGLPRTVSEVNGDFSRKSPNLSTPCI